MRTTDGESIEVVDPGMHNSNEGPDFLNARIRIGANMWAGNVEIHTRASDWDRHAHTANGKYSNVVLHIVEIDDCNVENAEGQRIPQMVLEVPENVRSNYEVLLREDRYPRCHSIISKLPRLMIDSWLTALQTERLEQKADRIEQTLAETNGDWERTFFIVLARSLGFGLNGDAFETWAKRIDLTQMGHHRDDLFQIETMFIGLAGLLGRTPEQSDDYYEHMNREYAYLAHKFTLKAMDSREWNFMRLRPQNFPHIRLSQLAKLYCSNQLNLSKLLEAENIDSIRQLFETSATEYWHTHYTFGSESKASEKRLGQTMIDIIIINTVVPILFSYGRRTANETLKERAFSLMEQLKPENNNIVRLWNECGLKVDNAADAQAIIQLNREYCNKRQCLRCRFGYEYIKKNHGI